MRPRPILLVVLFVAAVSVGLLAAVRPMGPPVAPGSLPSASAVPPPTVGGVAGPIGSPAPSASPGLPPAGAPGVRPIPVEALDARLDQLRRRAGIPGVSVTILWPDGRSWTGVSGYADVADREPVEADTAFAVASISKTFTAALILELVDERRLRLDDSVRRHLPAIGKVDPRITVRQLLDHTSGLHDYFLNTRIDRALRSDPDRAWTAIDALRYVRKPYAPPGTGFHYSNTNYLLLGLIAEKVTGRSVAGEIRDRFLGPLGLDTAFYQAVERPRAIVARGYRFSGPGRTAPAIDVSDGTGVRPFRSVVTAAGAAGSIAASSADIAKWAEALYRGDVLSPTGLANMLAVPGPGRELRPRIPYGLGVQEIVVGRWPTYGHSGRFLGFRGAMRYLPDTGLSIAVLTNQSRADPSAIVAGLLEIVFPIPEPCLLCR